MLSPITSTVTVAPLTISTCGAGAAPRATLAHVGADQLVDGFQNALLRNADEHDGLLVLDQLEAGEHALGIDADQELDRLAGIAGRVGEIGIEVDETLQLIAAIDRNDRRIALRRPEPVGALEEVGGRDLRQITGEVADGIRRMCPQRRTHRENGRECRRRSFVGERTPGHGVPQSGTACASTRIPSNFGCLSPGIVVDAGRED